MRGLLQGDVFKLDREGLLGHGSRSLSGRGLTDGA
jgi:hypothetical protein